MLIQLLFRHRSLSRFITRSRNSGGSIAAYKSDFLIFVNCNCLCGANSRQTFDISSAKHFVSVHSPVEIKVLLLA
jgi:hypothetical protein